MLGITELVGRSVSFRRLRHPFDVEGIPRVTEVRRLRIESVRDCDALPVDETTRRLNPHLIRGRWLVTGFDYDRRAERSFYLDRAEDVTLIDSPLRADAMMESHHAPNHCGRKSANSVYNSTHPSRLDRTGDESLRIAWRSEMEATKSRESSPCMQSVVVVILPRPDDWSPTDCRDVPPECELHHEPDASAARAFADGFNKAEMLQSKGWWAVT